MVGEEGTQQEPGGWMGCSSQSSISNSSCIFQVYILNSQRVKTMDFHFACHSHNLPKHPLGRGVSGSQACEVM